MRPASGAISPASWPIRVVLPAPFGPMIACTSPCATSRSMPSVAMHAAEALGQALDCEQRVSHGRSPRRASRRCRRARTARPAAASDRARSANIPQRASAASAISGWPTAPISSGSVSSSTSSATAPITGPKRAHAAEHHHDDEVAGARPVHHRRADEIGVVGEQRAGQAAQRAGDDEAGEAGSGRSESRSRACAARSSARPDHHAEARIDEPPDQIERRQAAARGRRNRRPCGWTDRSGRELAAPVDGQAVVAAVALEADARGNRASARRRA